MYLKELTVNGFKSFAKKSDFEFSAPITAIVGPNGSGKSNVAESFRFVLGEQSVKSMRGKKGEDLIWGGSEKISRGNRASVEVVFDNGSRTFALDFDEVKIERTVHRDGQNEYKINDSQVRLKDVHELLANANIGSTGHHIISQGEADRVLSAGAKERREMIEDALGLKVYQLKKQEADRKLAKTEENIAQVESLRREAAPHLKYLKKQVERAERSLQVKAELETTYSEYLRREDTYIARHFDRLEESKKAPEKQLEELKNKIVAAKKVLDSEGVDTADSDELVAARKHLSESESDLQETEAELNQLQGQISFLKRRIADSEKPQQVRKKLISYDALNKLVTEISEMITKALATDNESNFKEVLSKIAKQLKTFTEEEPEEEVHPAKVDTHELASLEKDLEKIFTKVQKHQEKRDELQSKVADLIEAKVAGMQEVRQIEKTLFALLQSERDLQSQLRQAESELQVLERDRNDFKQELQEAVTLIGRRASDYFSYEVKTSTGEVVSEEQIISEDRNIQRERRRSLEKLKIRLEELGVGETEELLKEYEDTKARDEFLEKELGDLSQSVRNLNQLIVEMQAKLEEQFVAGVDKITVEFDKFFKLMFGGGAAKLNLVTIKRRGSDEEDEGVAEEGVELDVSLPNKRVRGLDMLSGGERALTSIALIFAMSQVNPPPFIILDETDAALDEANSRRYGDMIQALAKKSQLVLITHNRETMSRAGILYGITMGTDGVSKVLSVKFDEAAVNAK